MNIERSKLKIPLVCLLVGIILGVTVTYCATPTTTHWISGGVYPSDGSFTIWIEGSNYFSKNAYGEIKYSGTNASLVTINSVNALSSGGKIFFKAGRFDFDSEVAVPYSIIFEGEGTTTTEIRATASIYLFSVTANDVCFRDIYFNGNSKTGDGIKFGAGANFAKVEFCRFYNFKSAVVVYGDVGNNILGRVSDCSFWTCDYHIKINSNSGYWTNDWVITRNRFQTAGTQAIQVGTGSGYATGCRIIANTIENSPTGIRLGNNSHYVRVFFNRIESASSYGVYIINAPNNIQVGYNFMANANVTVSSVGSNHFIAYNDGNEDYVSYHHYFSATTPPTEPTPMEGQLFWDTDDNKLYVYNGTHWNDYS